MQVAIQKIINGLGGDRYLKNQVRHEFDLLALINEGLPMESATFLQHNFVGTYFQR